jgi:hypothetical protein
LAKSKDLSLELNLPLKLVYKELCPKCRKVLLELATKAGAQQALESQIKSLLEKQLKM